MHNKILIMISAATLCFILISTTLSYSFISGHTNFPENSSIQELCRRQKNTSFLSPAYSPKIQAKHGMKVSLFLESLDIPLQAKNYITDVLNRATESWSLEQVEILVRLWYNPAFSDEVLEAIYEIADIKGCRNFIHKLTSAYPFGAVKQILNAAILKEEGKELICVETPIVDSKGDELTDIDIAFSENGEITIVEVKSLNDIIRNNGSNRYMRLEKLVEDFYTAPHGPHRNGNSIIFSDNILDKIKHFSKALDTLPVDEKPKKIIFRISFDRISRLDKKRVKDEIIRVVSKDITRRMKEFGMASEYEVEVEVIELDEFFSTHLFYEHRGNIALRLNQGNIDLEIPIKAAKASVSSLTEPRQEQLTQLLNLSGVNLYHNPQVISGLLLDYIDGQIVNYADEKAIPRWIAETFSSIEILRQCLIEFSRNNPNHESSRPNHLKNKFFRFMDAKLDIR